MAKIVIIGAGSGFGGRLSVDVLSRKPVQDSTIALCDIDAGKLDKVTRYVRRVIEAHRLPARVQPGTDRRKLLKGADFVITSISVGGPAYHGRLHDLEKSIPAKYGVFQSVADTIGVGGVFRFLRTAPVQLEFCRDIDRYCPDALLINYTNPMAMLSWLHSSGSRVRNVGLCHSVQNTRRQLASFVGVPPEEVSALVAGINHQAWFLRLRHKGQDLYPALRKAMDQADIYRQDAVRFEILRHFGYFVTESSSHNSEYVPYFRRNWDLIRRYHLVRHRADDEKKRRESYKRSRRAWLHEDSPEKVPIPELRPSEEYASGIIEAAVTNVPFPFNGSVPNDGLIPNLPGGCSVEVPCVADAEGIRPCHVGELPPQLAALNRSNIAVQELAVRAILSRDRQAAFHACALDPLTAAVAPLHDIRAMFEELWKAEKEYLAYFDGKK